ncbi:transcriptional regulator, MarR family [Caldicellulosiruptor owensensis OL]|uniref:Transcriptional regulator, MarR family n=1 Tax=Caldicellulosiruptor owensensis (strain ATCC 700167 / DSM 13100 / OL) TaxID=632518 RepID=E4Q708_CALOW|nr:MarR family transcriptional regulator [Caldicellulosiruptor owensensis]ADQ05688.1 transcriptional regulator, MarR family [Caldicellulosiruptor owensensis OL]
MGISKEMINQIAENMLSLFPLITNKVLKKDVFSERYGLPPRFIYILHLIDVFGPINMSELAKRLNISASNLTPIIDKLISEEYVERLKDDSDRRVSIVQSTEKGREFLSIHTRWVNQNLEINLSRLSEDEIEELWYLLKRLKKLVLKMIGCCDQKGGQ